MITRFRNNVIKKIVLLFITVSLIGSNVLAQEEDVKCRQRLTGHMGMIGKVYNPKYTCLELCSDPIFILGEIRYSYNSFLLTLIAGNFGLEYNKRNMPQYLNSYSVRSYLQQVGLGYEYKRSEKVYLSAYLATGSNPNIHVNPDKSYSYVEYPWQFSINATCEFLLNSKANFPFGIQASTGIFPYLHVGPEIQAKHFYYLRLGFVLTLFD